MYISRWQSKGSRLTMCGILAASQKTWHDISRRSEYCRRLKSAKPRSPLYMLWDWEHGLQRDVAKSWRNLTTPLSGKSIHPIFHPFLSRVSICGFHLNEFFPPSRNALSIRHEGTKSDSGKMISASQLLSDWISERYKERRRKMFTE